MIKKNLKTLLISSFACLLPIFSGLLLWNKLPNELPIHWDIHGNVDDWASKGFIVFFLPLFMAAMNWLCAIAAEADPKKNNYHPKLIHLVFWICPILGLVLSAITYVYALGYEPNVGIIMPIIMGVFFIVIGNLMPKARQSYTLGIRIPWTLNSEENWNATHRFAGKVWVLGGILIAALAPFDLPVVCFTLLLVFTLLPILYSYLYYRKHKTSPKEDSHGKETE